MSYDRGAMPATKSAGGCPVILVVNIFLAAHTLIAWAKQLGRNDCAAVLQRTLDEEKATDKMLTQMAESAVNLRAAS